MAPALFHTGDFLSMFDYMDKMLAVYLKQRERLAYCC